MKTAFINLPFYAGNADSAVHGVTKPDMHSSFLISHHAKHIGKMTNSRLQSHLKKLLQILAMLVMLAKTASATEFTQNDWNVTYVPCDGYIEINILYFNTDGINDWMQTMDVYYLTSGGTQTRILKWRHDSEDCSDCTNTHTWDGETFDYLRPQGTDRTSIAFQYVENTDNDHRRLRLRFYDLPDDLIGETATIRIDGMWHGGGGDGDVLFDNWEKTADIWDINPPTALNAYVDQACDRVRVTWTNPSNNICPTGNWEVLVYRNGTYLGTGQQSGFYDDFTAVKGQDYQYTVRSQFKPNAYMTDQSELVEPSVLGRRLGALPPPTNLTASRDRCVDQSIFVQWVYANATAATFYRIERKTVSATDYTPIDTIPGSSLQYFDNTPLVDVEYLYRIRTINVCGDLSAPSSPTSVPGLVPGPPVAPTNVVAAQGDGEIILTWDDNSSTETGFIIVRTYLGGIPVTTEVSANDTSYTDSTVGNCISYTYTVKAKGACHPEGIGTASATQIIQQSLEGTFPAGSFDASKGYFPNHVVLEWNNNNGNLISIVRIYRRILESGDSYALLFTLPTNSGIYNDVTAEAGLLYEYLIFGESACENETFYSDSITSIGFRRKVGTVTGQVTYTGGIAVEDVRISAESTTGIYGRSLSFPGNSTSEIVIPDADALDFDSTLLIEAWIKPAADGGKIVEKEKSYILEHSAANNQFQFTIHKTNELTFTTGIPDSLIPANTYSHLAVQIHQRRIQFYVNGNLVKDQSLISFFSGTIHLHVREYPIRIGRSYSGLMDEIRIWSHSKTAEEIERDYTRIMIGTEPTLTVYLNLNEGVGRHAYDASKTGLIFNKHHAAFQGTVTWSNVIPTSSQLSVSAFTNASGNYTLVIPYNGAGEVFEITPSFGIHEFTPSVTALFIGDGAPVHNNVNFLDRSSFRVTGSVNFLNTTCGVPDAFLKVDGEILIVDGVPAKTDATGAFDIRVPIGQHHLEVEQSGHVYSVGRFPATGKYNFQEDLAGIAFVDSTRVRVVGRVVGGLREARKVPGLGKSINNIGVAEIILTSQQGNGCAKDTILTNTMTGEYEVWLPPLKYVPQVRIVSNPTIDFGTLNLVDLSASTSLMTAYDTVFNTDGSVVSVDSIQFHKQLDYIHRVDPIITVFDRDGVSPFIGDSIYTYTDAMGMTQTRNLRTDPFRWPVFTERDGGSYFYRCMIRVFEPYVNPVTNVTDSVPTTDGIIRIENEFADFPLWEFEMKDYNDLDTLRSMVYSFRIGKPSFTENLSIPEYSYAKKLEINLYTSSGNAIPWLPITNPPMGGDGVYRAYLLATQTNGDQFVTFGPDVPEYVLRDPPGSNSVASRETGSTHTQKSSWSWDLSAAAHTKDDIFVGAAFSVGVGVSTATDIKSNTTVGFEAEIGGGNSGYQTITTTNTKTWSTNDAFSIAPGAPSDVYIGTSTNLQCGIIEELAIIPNDLCSQVDCIGESESQPHADFTFGKRYGLSVIPGGYETQFQYTEYAIKYDIIPDLIQLRNVMLQSNPKYVSHLSTDDENYGKNNDDTVFGTMASTNTPDEGDFADLTGPSYTYSAVSLADTLSGDSVRVINNQIRQWEKAIWLNEWEKVNIDNEDAIDSLREAELDALYEEYEDTEIAYYALVTANVGAGIPLAYGLIVTPGPGSAIAGYAVFASTTAVGIALSEISDEHEEYLAKKQLIEDRFDQMGSAINYSLSGGTSLSSSMTHQLAAGNTGKLEYSISAELLLEVEAKVNNNGVGLEKGLTLKHSIGRDWSDESDSSEVVSFTLADSDVGDLYSVDVFPSLFGWGPVFKNKAGGATSCPHEPEVVTEYYEPGTMISDRTQQIDKPTISVSQIILTNIPADEPAVFNLTLGNISEVGYTNEYNLSVVAATNPFGAIVRFDGLASQSVIIPGNAAVNKVMTIEKGAGPVYEYDSILVVFTSPCQYTGGSGFNTDIGDSVYVSAHFLPSCTDVAMATPDDKWVLNNSFNDTMPVAIVDYNINHSELQQIRFDYKPSSSANWIGLQTFLKDTSGQGGVPIPTNAPFTLYDWDVSQLTDGFYDVRVSSTCTDDVTSFSPTHSGVIDRINPHPFGNPSPADGIASPNDEISIRFNEPIDLGSINPVFNFDIRGVLNGTETDHSTSLFFDGVNDYLEVPGGLPIQSRDFTLEFSAKRNRTGEEALFSMGTDPNERLFIGFNASDRFVVRFNGTEVASNAAIADQEWHYFAVSYDHTSESIQMYVADEMTTAFVANNGNTTMFTDLNASGVLEIGRNSVNHGNYFRGNIHEVRVWNSARSLNAFSAMKSMLISGAEAGILYNWRMDEASGNVAAEHLRKRDADIYGATWEISPNGNAVECDGISDVVKIAAGDVAITEGMDFTLEFWFSSDATSAGTLFSNGKADGIHGDSAFAWRISKEADHSIHVLHNGMDFVATETNFFDGAWHHFALVLQRTGNLSAYIDGELHNSTHAVPFGPLGGSHMYLGAGGYHVGAIEHLEEYFDGKMDEFRFWNTARKLAQLRRDKQHRMSGDELGLKVYLPFEEYSTDPTGIPILTPTFNDQVVNAHIVENLGATLIAQTPTIKLQRPVQQIAFTYSVNNDQIIITPTTSQEIIENVTLDITVEGIKDLRGNVMESPATWIAYMDKNQVVWQDDLLQFELIRGDALKFTSAVINQGGAAKAFQIQNIPPWLDVTPVVGTVNPNSSVPVSFSVNETIQLGDYTQDITLITDFNFPERLTLQLKVRDQAPAWAFDPANFEHNMSIIGRFKINGVISTDAEDRIVAMVGQEIRGVGQLEYVPELDIYLVFLNIFSNTGNAEALSFRIWDASAGLIYPDVLPTNLQFQTEAFIGSVVNPVTFESGNTISFEVPMIQGWTWLGFPLGVSNPTNLNDILISLTHTAGDEITTNNASCDYNGNSNQFVGTLDDNQHGIKPEKLYKMRQQVADILIMKGTVINPTTKPITLANGWNWIGFISIRNQTVDQALGNLTPTTGDILKSKSQFAIYDNGAGWIGSLKNMTPGSGYMYKSTGTKSFTYPLAGMFNPLTNQDATIETRSPKWEVDVSSFSGNMTVIATVEMLCSDMPDRDQMYLGIRDKAGRYREITRIPEEGDEDLLYLTIAGDEAEILDVYFLNEVDFSAIPTGEQIQFEPNLHRGDLRNPVHFTIVESVCEALTKPEAPDDWLVYPSPFRETITLVYTTPALTAAGDIRISDISGRIVHAQDVTLLTGRNEFTIHLSDSVIPAGMYMVELRTAGQNKVARLIKSN